MHHDVHNAWLQPSVCIGLKWMQYLVKLLLNTPFCSDVSMTAVAFIAEEVAEFVDAPALGLSLFVQSTWSAGLPEKLPEGPNAVLCRLLACDGLRCWEGFLAA